MNTSDFTIVAIETPTLGDRSYLVHDGEVGFVVDPQRDIDRVLNLLEEHRVRLAHVFETHIHNDYVTGGLALAEHTGAAYHVNGADNVSFNRSPISDGQTVEVGPRMRVTALATPGHTFTHLSYALADVGTPDDTGLDHSVGVFSGGSMLYGATGRPDLLGKEHTDTLVRHQHASAHRLADLLPDETGVFPTHGFGSFCSATQSEASESTIGQERKHNPVLTQDEETYVRGLLAGLGAWPAYYAHMAPANSAGPSEPDLSLPAVADATELRGRIEAGEWVVDLRNRTAFAAGHAPGTLNFGLDGAFATYLGWLITWGTPVTLLGQTPEAVAEAQRELVRIGIDRPAAHATGSPQDWAEGELASFPTATFPELADVRHHRDVVILDVRRSDEYHAAAIKGAVNIPLHELWGRLDEVPAGELWVHCAAGYRASVAASMLDAAGRSIVAIDDSFDNAEKVGLHLVGPESGVTLLLAVVAGVLIGLSLGALGGGGSILAVPVLVYALDQSPAQATTGSLVVVGVTSLVSAVAAYRSGNVLLARGVTFGVVALGGAAAGAKLSAHVSEPVLLAAFAVLMLLVGGLMAVRQVRSRRDRGPDTDRELASAAAVSDQAGAPAGTRWADTAAVEAHPSSRTRVMLDDPIITFSPTFACQCPRALKVLVTATVVGLLTGFLGVGGGFLVVPSLVLALSLPMGYAAGTSLVVISMTSAVALGVRAGLGNTPEWGVVLALTLASALGGLLGARLAARTDTARLSGAFTVLVLGVALYTAARAFPALL